jgi:hypothetical protein
VIIFGVCTPPLPRWKPGIRNVFSTHQTAPAGVPGTSKCLVHLEKNTIKVSDFGLITLSKCRSRSWEQDNSCQGLENLTVCYDKCLQLVWWLSGKIKDWGLNIKMCCTLYLPPLTSVHPPSTPPRKKGGGRKKRKTQFLAVLVCEYILWCCISHVVLCCRCRMVTITVTRGMGKCLQLTYCS